MIEGIDDSLNDPDGTACSGTGGYSDLAPGGAVIITNATGAAVATTTLSGGGVVNVIKNTASERADRETLIDSIYALRVAKAYGDPVAIAQLNLDRANLRLKDYDTPGPPPPFEGLPFQAEWCRMTFTVSGLSISSAYGITVTHRGTTNFPLDQIRANGGTVQMTVQ